MTLSPPLRTRTLVKSVIQPDIQLEVQDSVLISTMIAQAVENLNLSIIVCSLGTLSRSNAYENHFQHYCPLVLIACNSASQVDT